MENVFNVKYNTKLDRLGKFRVWSFVKNHKFLTIVLMNFLIFSCINFYLIFSFMKILESI